ncbi:MAG: hypothetical protein KF754_11580 [Planctomycetes bacterium]|nr:hypothetical protein [Planctomycetota bacterium]
MRPTLLILLCFCALLAGCRGYSLDMSGLNEYSGHKQDDASERFSMSALDRAASPGLEESSRGRTLADADYITSREMDRTNDRLSMSRLDRLSTRHVEPTGDGIGIADLERVTSRKLDPDNNKIR